MYIDDPEDPNHEVRYEMTYEGVKEYVGKKHPTFVKYEANLPLLQKLSSNHVDAGTLKAWEDDLKSMGGLYVKVQETGPE